MAVAAYLVGLDEACERAWEAAHRAALGAGDRACAARCACWLALLLLLHLQTAKSNGWMARAARLRLPAPAEFLWQYINVTPLAPLVAEAPDAARRALEQHAVDAWQPYVRDGVISVEQPTVLATGRKLPE